MDRAEAKDALPSPKSSSILAPSQFQNLSSSSRLYSLPRTHSSPPLFCSALFGIPRRDVSSPAAFPGSHRGHHLRIFAPRTAGPPSPPKFSAFFCSFLLLSCQLPFYLDVFLGSSFAYFVLLLALVAVLATACPLLDFARVVLCVRGLGVA